MELREETMLDYAKELEASFRPVNVGDIMTGTVISVDETGVVLDLQYYAQGIIRAEDMSDDPTFQLLEDIHVGDTVQATVIRRDDGMGNILLSRKEAVDTLAWDVLQSYLEAETEKEVKIIQAVNAGVVAYLEGTRGFIPASHLALSYVEDLESWVGRTVPVKVITVDAEKKKLVLSAKEVLKKKEADSIRHKISMLVPGTILEGTVESLMPYGAFINLPDDLSGLVHISQISQKRIKRPSEVLSVGDKVKVKILNTNDGKISLSIKAVEELAAAEESEKIEVEAYTSKEEATTSLGDLFKNLKF